MHENVVGQPEIPKTQLEGISTSALLRLLSFFRVTEQDLKNEVYQDNLPAPEDGLWSRMASTRAKRLYRLRARGLRGKALKIVLFIADGWGWEHIMETCAIGYERITALSLNGVEKYARAKGELDFFVEEIAAHHHRSLIKRVGDRSDLQPTSNETTAFSVGILRNGVPLKGGTSRRLLEPMLKGAFPGLPEKIVNLFVYAFDLLVIPLDLRVERQVERLRTSSPPRIEHARLKMRDNLYFIRKQMKRLGGEEVKSHSLNILTLFGQAKNLRDLDLSRGDVKLSPVFLLGGFIGGLMALTIAFEEFLDALPLWLSKIVREHVE